MLLSTRQVVGSAPASATCHDVAGYSSAAHTVSGIKLDTVAPAPTILSPLNNAVLNVGARVVANFRYSAGDVQFPGHRCGCGGNQSTVSSTYRVQQLQ